MREVLSVISMAEPEIGGMDKERFEAEAAKDNVSGEAGETDAEKAQEQAGDTYGEEVLDPEYSICISVIGHFLFLMLSSCIALIVIGSIIWVLRNHLTAPDSGEAKTKQFVVMEQTEEETERFEERPEDTGNNSYETDRNEDQNWQNIIFGGGTAQTITGRIQVKCPDSEEIAGSGFSESSFIKAAGSFLKEEGIPASGIRFEKKVQTSADGAYAWKAVIEGKADQDLLVLWYREYPDQYILILVPGEDEAVSSENSTGSMQPAADSSSISQPENRQSPQPTQSTTVRSYDATILSVKDIPGTLLNYISNRYDLQYSLYDYLYKNGHRDVNSVQVTGYEIDPDRKEATIYLKADDGTSITGVYSRAGNRYTYHGG